MVPPVMNGRSNVEYPVLMDANMPCRNVLSVVAACRAIFWAAAIALCVPVVAFAQEGQPADGPIGNALLPRDLTPMGMFQNADIVVQAVLVAAERAGGHPIEVRRRGNAVLGRRRKRAHQDLEQLRQAEPGLR